MSGELHEGPQSVRLCVMSRGRGPAVTPQRPTVSAE